MEIMTWCHEYTSKKTEIRMFEVSKGFSESKYGKGKVTQTKYVNTMLIYKNNVKRTERRIIPKLFSRNNLMLIRII